MEFKRLQGSVVILFILSLILFISVKSPNRPDLLAQFVGCYTSSENGLIQRLEVTKDGRLVFGEKTTPVVVYQDKGGLSLAPEARVVATASGKIIYDSGTSLLIRIDSDQQGFEVFGPTGENIPFRKRPCEL